MPEYAHRVAFTAKGGHTGRKTTFVNDATPRDIVEALVEVLQVRDRPFLLTTPCHSLLTRCLLCPQRSGNEVPRWLEGMATAVAPPAPIPVQ